MPRQPHRHHPPGDGVLSEADEEHCLRGQCLFNAHGVEHVVRDQEREADNAGALPQTGGDDLEMAGGQRE